MISVCQPNIFNLMYGSQPGTAIGIPGQTDQAIFPHISHLTMIQIGTDVGVGYVGGGWTGVGDVGGEMQVQEIKEVEISAHEMQKGEMQVQEMLGVYTLDVKGLHVDIRY